MIPIVGQKLYRVYLYDQKIVERTITSISMIKDKPNQYRLELDYGDSYATTFDGNKSTDQYGSDYYPTEKECALKMIQFLENSNTKAENEIKARKEKIKALKKEYEL